MLNIVVCDDNRKIVEDVKSILKDFNEGTFSISTYINEDSLIDDIEDERLIPDVLFMDIKLNHSNGIVLAKKIMDMLPLCQIIFISGYDDYYLDVYEVEHIYFVKKPIKKRTIEKALFKAIERIEESKREIFSFTSNGHIHTLPIKSILYFEKDKRKILVRTSQGVNYDYYGKMEDLLGSLNNNFIRCHNSYVINLTKVRSMENDKFIINENKEIPISRLYRRESRLRFIKYIEELTN